MTAATQTSITPGLERRAPTTSASPATASTATAPRSAPPPAPAYTYTGLSCGTTYTLAFRPTDAAGNSCSPAEATTTRTTNACHRVHSRAWWARGTSTSRRHHASADISGNGNNGAISGATRSTGKYGGGLQFDGVNDLVTIADSASLDLTKAMTLEAWVSPRSSPAPGARS